MTQSYLEKAYETRDTSVIRALYDDWAESYDRDIGAPGYATPPRAATVPAEHLNDKSAPTPPAGGPPGAPGPARRGGGGPPGGGGPLVFCVCGYLLWE